jgi:hypothetical protein
MPRPRSSPTALAAALAAGAVAAQLAPTAARAQTAASAAAAQPATVAAPAAPRPVTQADYDRWNTLAGATLSRDGRWLAYTRTPQVGDGELVVRATTGAAEYRVPRGYVGRPQLSVTADSGWSAPPAQFSVDGRVLAALVYEPRAAFDQARRAKRREPRAALAIVGLADGAVRRVADVRSFAMPRSRGGWLAYLLEPADTTGGARGAAGRDSARAPAAPAAAAATPGGSVRPVADSLGRARRKEYGSTLVLVDLTTGGETRVDDVTAFAFGDSARHLAYTVSSRTSARDGAYVRALGAPGTAPGGEVALRTGRGDYRALTFDRAGRQLAFVTNAAEYAQPRPRFALVHVRLGGGAPDVRTAVAADAAGAAVNGERGLVVSDRGVSFARDGDALVFGLAPAPQDSIPADSLADKAVLDLWHYREARLQPQQRLESTRDRVRAYTAVYTPATGRAVRLGTDTLSRVTLSDDGRTALATGDLAYALSQLWGEGGSDVSLVDARTGARTPVARRVPFNATLSPSGRYVTWFADGRWRSYDARERRTSDLTGGLRGVRFDQETWDTPSEPAPWGDAGYTDGERDLLLYSRYDVWAVDPAGRRPARVVTDSVGARNRLVLRVARVRDDRTLDPTAPLLLTAFDDRTKASGFYRDRVDGASAPERVDDGRRPLRRARAAQGARRRGVRGHAADLHRGARTCTWAAARRAHPRDRRQPAAARGRVGLGRAGALALARRPAARRHPLQAGELRPGQEVPDGGVLLRAALRQPAPVQPAGRAQRRQPDRLREQRLPGLLPDIAYTNGYPGQSALKSIMPGVQSIAARGFLDEGRVGIAGQSWGGYQGAYIITQTPYFRAAFLGAPVANMTSAYGGIRWESGVARAFQYEKGQSRIGRSPWDALPRYLENSPLFAVDRVTTPMLIMSNDADGAVPWYQGIELFVGRGASARRRTCSTTTATGTTRASAPTSSTSTAGCSSSSRTTSRASRRPSG